ncbi:hypothetical protein BDB01DRAFT_853651 [Pilobolus umbonatus]|nr:hypothetical protein BDB01DRAFT_853651 [Pilobolus umbonatus]
MSNQSTHEIEDKQSFEKELESHYHAIKTGNYEKAIQSFVLLQSYNMKNVIFQSYLVKIAENIDPIRDTDLSRFFATLPCLLQSNIIDFARDQLEEKDSARAFQILFDYIQAFPRHAYKYLIGAINLLILCTQKTTGDDRKRRIELLVTELFPRLYKQRLLLTKNDRIPSIKSTDSKHFIILPYNLFGQFLLLGQRFYIKKHKWEESIRFTCNMLSACGYNGLEQLDSVSQTIRLQYLKEHRNSIRIDTNENMSPEDLQIISTVMCEYMGAMLQFVQLAYYYYKAICGTDSPDQKSCLIPVCSFQNHINGSVENTLNFSDNTKIPRYEHEDEKTRAQGLESYCVKGVDNALQILSKAADCLRHIVDLWYWAIEKVSEKSIMDELGSWEQELCRVIDGYNLPFDMHNAVLLVRSDLALSSPSVPGNLAKALELSQSICDRIEIQRRQERGDRTSTEMDIPFMFAFRVLYNIGVIYLLVGSLQQSTLEIAIILSVFPIPNGLNERDFIYDEIDCHTVANIFYGHEFGLMRVTQEGLVVRCIKHLVVSLDNESEQRRGMASIDSALKWDEKAGSMIVLMQYGWPYWCDRTELWNKIMNRISEKGIFKNREFLEYLYVSDVLQAIRHLHLMGTVIMDIIPPEFALISSYRHLITDQENEKESAEYPYQSYYSNSILPSTSMSPSWYSASTQKSSFAKWMSPSFYYSRPATSVILPSLPDADRMDDKKDSYIPKDTVTRCLEYRIRRYSTKITPQRMRHVLQRFLKSMILKSNEDT